MKHTLLLLVGAVLLASCATVSSTQATRDWMTASNFSEARHTLIGDVHHAGLALGKKGSSPAALHTVCAVLLLDADAANAALPTPDAQASSLLATAYQTLGDGANTCYKSFGNPRMRAQAQRFLRLALAQLSFGTLRLAVASGH